MIVALAIVLAGRGFDVFGADGVWKGAAAAFAETFRELPVFEWDPGSDWRNVKDFGAVGDGQADDTAALQAAFDTLDNGVVIYLPAGTYRITDTLKWCGKKSRLTNTAVIGCGEKTRIVWDGPKGGRMVKDSGLSLARYFGFVLDGRGKASVGLWNHQQNRFETQCRYSYLAFRDFDRENGVALLSETNSKDGQSDSEPTFENCIFDGMKTGVSFTSYNDYDFSFRGCLFRQCGSGIYCCSGNFYASACRFEQNGVDVHCAPCPEHNSSVRRCVSVGSGTFLKGHANVASLTVENCTIADWTNKTAFDWIGPILAFNNTFLPGANKERYTIGMGDIYLTGVLQGGNTKVKGTRPALALPIESNFLRKTVRTPRKCFDVRRDFGAKGDGKTDDTAAIRAAIAAAKAHGKDAIAYVPRGRFRITETLALDGGGYMFGGNGAGSVVLWDGDRAKNAIEVVNPQDLVLWQIRVDCIDTVDNQTAKWNGEKGANICQRGSANGADGVRALPSTLNPQPSTVTYYGVFCYGKYQGRGMAERQGFLFKDLTAKDVVNVPYAEGNIRLENCGESTVLFGVAHEGSITVDGPTGKGFLGGCARLSTHCAAPLQVRKNGSFVWSDYYLEQGYDTLVALSGGTEWPKGRVTVGFPKFARTQNAAETAAKTNLYHYVSIDNYQGEFDIASIQVYPVYDKTNTMWIDNVGTGAAVNFAAPVWYRFGLGADAGVVVNQFAHRPMNEYGAKDDAFLANLYDDLTRLGELDLALNFAN